MSNWPESGKKNPKNKKQIKDWKNIHVELWLLRRFEQKKQKKKRKKSQKCGWKRKKKGKKENEGQYERFYFNDFWLMYVFCCIVLWNSITKILLISST